MTCSARLHPATSTGATCHRLTYWLCLMAQSTNWCNINTKEHVYQSHLDPFRALFDVLYRCEAATNCSGPPSYTLSMLFVLGWNSHQTDWNMYIAFVDIYNFSKQKVSPPSPTLTWGHTTCKLLLTRLPRPLYCAVDAISVCHDTSVERACSVLLHFIYDCVREN